MFFLLLACSTPDSAATDTDTAPKDTADPVDTETTDNSRLDDGRYTGTIVANDSSSCGAGFDAFLTLSLGTFPLTNAGSGFSLDYGGGLTQDCTYGDTGVSCEPYATDVPIDDTAALTLTVTIPTFVVTSATTFEQQEDVAVTCVGDGCDEVNTTWDAGMPCTAILTESWSK